MTDLKTILPYIPLSWPQVSSRFLRSYLEMTGSDVQAKLAERGYRLLDPLVLDTFPLDRNRNEAVTLALSNKYSADFMLFLDADNIHPKDAIVGLLDHLTDEFPVVSGLYFGKRPPYKAICGHYSSWEKHELKRETLKSMGFVDDAGNQCLFFRQVHDFDTVQPIDVSGMGCLLVKTEIFRKLDLPYFGYFNSYSLGGDFTIHHCSEEMLFFAKLHKAGIKTLLVPSVRCGHEVTKVIGSPEL